VARCAETPRWQFFSGQAYYEDRQPCDATTLMKFRKLLGVEQMNAWVFTGARSSGLMPCQTAETAGIE